MAENLSKQRLREPFSQRRWPAELLARLKGMPRDNFALSCLFRLFSPPGHPNDQCKGSPPKTETATDLAGQYGIDLGIVLLAIPRMHTYTHPPSDQGHMRAHPTS